MKDIYNPNCNPKIYGTIYSTIVKYPKMARNLDSALTKRVLSHFCSLIWITFLFDEFSLLTIT